MIDLHTHSNASDGSLTPTELIAHASNIGLEAIALTDHDTVDGISEALAAAKHALISFIAGIEISAQYSDNGTMHILGYCVERNDPDFIEALEFLKKSRKERNPKIIGLLNKAGVSITMEDVIAEAGDGQVGRPHFARAIIKKGFASSITEAFEKYIAKGAPCYVDKVRLSPRQSIEMIRNARGIPVLAHPKTLNIPEEEIDHLIKNLVADGLGGIECLYFSHTQEETARYQAHAKKYGLIITGGTDFHGKNKPKVRLGVGHGGMNIPNKIFDDLMREYEKLKHGNVSNMA